MKKLKNKYIISIDQSTQGTKALLLDEKGAVTNREYISHRQIIDDNGYISHDPIEIYNNVITAVKRLIEKSLIPKAEIACLAISNQRETAVVWDKNSGKPIADAVVWQCSRSADICRGIEKSGISETVFEKTGLRLAPYFPASKFAWLIENTAAARGKAEKHELCFGTVDTWLIYRLTGGREYKTDYSNASRTQLFNIHSLKWDSELCGIFGIDIGDLPSVCDSDSLFGYTDFEGYLDNPIPIHSALGDSHAALFGHGCISPGMIKATYGTGSSIMMNVGAEPCQGGKVSSSVAWKIGGDVNYVLEGNINYAGAVITWLKDSLGLINSPSETEELCRAAKKDDDLYLVPAFTGIGAPYWEPGAKGMLTGLTGAVGRAEIVRAAVECIAYQVRDVIEAMRLESGIDIKQIRADGGPTKNEYLMQFQSDIADAEIRIPQNEELSAIGAAYAAGLAAGIYDKKVFENNNYTTYKHNMNNDTRERRLKGWKKAVGSVLKQTGGSK